MHKDLKRIEGSIFKTYIGENFPLYSETTYGELTIVDNTGEQNIDGLVPNTYNLFVDHIHIASGYGFSTLDSFDHEMERIAYSYDNVIDLLNYREAAKNESLFEMILRTPTNNSPNHFGTYNAYGFETSFVDFSITNEPSANGTPYSYQLNISKYELSHILPIEVKYHEDNKEITTKENRFPLDIKVSIYDNIGNIKDSLYKEDIRINGQYLPTGNNDERDTLLVNNDEFNANSDYNTYYFNFDYPNYTKDLVVEYTFNNNVVGTYILPNILKWHEQLHYYPTGEFVNEGNESLVFDDPNNKGIIIKDTLNEESIDIDNLKIIIGESSGEELNNKDFKNTENILPNEIVSLQFDSGEHFLYDHVIMTDTNPPLFDLEFYFNGIKSNNWKKTQHETLGDNLYYYVWTSPQRYHGEHVWNVKLTKIENKTGNI